MTKRDGGPQHLARPTYAHAVPPARATPRGRDENRFRYYGYALWVVGIR